MPGKLVGPSLGRECAVGVGVMLLERDFSGWEGQEAASALWAWGRGGPQPLFKKIT